MKAKKLLTYIISSVICFGISTAFAGEENNCILNFADGSCDFTGLNNGLFYKRFFDETESAYKCSGSGEVGFRIPGALSNAVMADSNSIYTVTANVMSASPEVKLQLTTPGGFVGKEAIATVTAGTWTPISLDFVPDASTALDTLTFSAVNDAEGDLLVKDAAIIFKGERYLLDTIIEFTNPQYSCSGPSAKLNITENTDGTGTKTAMGQTSSDNSYLGGQKLSLRSAKNSSAGVVMFNLRDTGIKKGKISCKVAVSTTDATLDGTNLDVTIGLSNVTYLKEVSSQYYTTHQVRLNHHADGYLYMDKTLVPFVTVEHEFDLGEGNDGYVNVQFIGYNSTAQKVTYVIDDLAVYAENEY